MSDVKTIEQAPIEQTPQPIPEVVQKQYDHLVETIRAYNPGADFAQIDAAFRYAAAHHGTQKRKDGSPFVTHPIAVAQIVAEELHLDSESIIAALLHDCIEDTDATYDDIAKRFSPTVADLVEGVTKLTRVHYTSKEEEQMENLRKMLMAMAKDIRVILIKICRPHCTTCARWSISPPTSSGRSRSRRWRSTPPSPTGSVCRRMKWELEDLSLQIPRPHRLSTRSTDALEREVHGIRRVHGAHPEADRAAGSTEDHIPFRRVYGRMKHPYSIYRKMYAQSKTLDEVFDLFAFRVIVDTVAGLLQRSRRASTTCYKPRARPLQGLYRHAQAQRATSRLHTTVIGRERHALRGADPHAGDARDRRIRHRRPLEVQAGHGSRQRATSRITSGSAVCSKIRRTRTPRNLSTP